MAKFLEKLKNDLNEMSDSQLMITVKRSDLEQLVKAYEKQPAMDYTELGALVGALRYYESEFGLTDKEWVLLDRLQKDLEGEK